MRTMIGWVSDPYLHVIVIGLVLAWLATMSASPNVSGPGIVFCQNCQEAHDPAEARCMLAGAISGLVKPQE